MEIEPNSIEFPTKLYDSILFKAQSKCSNMHFNCICPLGCFGNKNHSIHSKNNNCNCVKRLELSNGVY